MDPDDIDRLKNGVEIAKNCFEILGFLSIGVYFFYRLLAGFFVPCRLAIEITCDTPFRDKRLLRTIVKLKNTGPASIHIEEAKLWVFEIPNATPHDVPIWPLRGEKRTRPSIARLDAAQLDFQRLSFDKQLHLYVAKEERKWVNLETAGEQQRQFLFRLEDGLYKVEFRIVGTPMFGRRFGFTRAITNPLFHLSRAGQWVATAVIQISTAAVAMPPAAGGEGDT